MTVWYSALVVAAAVAMSAAAYTRLPDRVPVHWGIGGQPDRWGSRFEGAVLFPVLMFGAWLLLRFLPRIDPRAPNYAKMQSTYDAMVNAVLTVLLLVHAMVLAAGLGYAVPVGRITPLLIGALFLTLGNVLPRARPNWWFGIRTPWTLSSDRVWARTHRVGGYAMTAAGIVILAGAALPGIWPFTVFILASAVAAIGSIVYSYISQGLRWEFSLALTPEALVSTMQNTVRLTSASPDAPPAQSGTLEFRRDSVIAHMTAPTPATQRFATTAGALPFVNLSAAIAEQIVRRARAVGGARTVVPMFVVAGAQTIPAEVTWPAADTAVIMLGGVELRAAVAADASLRGAVVPAQGVRFTRVDTDMPVTVGPPPDYSAPAVAPYTAEEVTLRGQSPTRSHDVGSLSRASTIEASAGRKRGRIRGRRAISRTTFARRLLLACPAGHPGRAPRPRRTQRGRPSARAVVGISGGRQSRRDDPRLLEDESPLPRGRERRLQWLRDAAVEGGEARDPRSVGGLGGWEAGREVRRGGSATTNAGGLRALCALLERPCSALSL